MAEQARSAVFGECASRAVSFLSDKFVELAGVSDKVQKLKWKVLKIQSAIEESKKYHIDNEALQKMQQTLIDAAQEGNEMLEAFKYCLDMGVVSLSQNQGIVQRTNCETLIGIAFLFITWKPLIVSPICHYARNLLIKMREIQKLNRILNRIEPISEDIGDFLEMLGRQKRIIKDDKRWRYKPYLRFIKLAYLELAQDALGYRRINVSWMQFLVLEIVAFVETRGESGLKACDARLSDCRNVAICCDVLE